MTAVDNNSICPSNQCQQAEPRAFSGQGHQLGKLKQLLDSSLQEEALKLKQQQGASAYESSSFHIDISFEYSATVIQDQVQKSVHSKFNFSLDATFVRTQSAAGEGVDPFSPENVANRIMSFVEGVFNRFSQEKDFPGKSADEVKQEINTFVKMAGEAVQEGFKEAKAILGAFEAAPGKDSEDKTEKTLDLVLNALKGLPQKLLGDGKPEGNKEQLAGSGMQAQQFSLHAEMSYERSVSVVEDEVAKRVNTTFNASIDISMMSASVAGANGNPHNAGPHSPEHVAERIIGFVEKVFDSFMAGKEMSGKTSDDLKAEAEKFIDMAQKAVEDGFQQAREVIGSFNTLPEDNVPVKVDTIESNVLEQFKSLYNSLLEKLNTFPRDENAGALRTAGFRLEVSAEHSVAVLQDNVNRSFSESFGFSMNASFQQVAGEDGTISPERLTGRFMDLVKGAFDQYASREQMQQAGAEEQEKYVNGFVATTERATEAAFNETKGVLGRSRQAHGSHAVKALDDTNEKVRNEFAGLAAVLKERVKEKDDDSSKVDDKEDKRHEKTSRQNNED